MALTAAATLLLELQTAIYAGVLASLFFYLKRTSRPRVQQSREGDADILRVAGRFSSARRITCRCACSAARAACGDRCAAGELHRLLGCGYVAPRGAAVAAVAGA
jgi:hypothetical protein